MWGIGTGLGLVPHLAPPSPNSLNNASLAGIALYLWRKSLLIPILGMLVSTPITEFFSLTGLPSLTAPFVLACWLVIAVGTLEPYFERFVDVSNGWRADHLGTQAEVA
jgi:hypothetical protein